MNPDRQPQEFQLSFQPQQQLIPPVESHPLVVFISTYLASTQNFIPIRRTFKRPDILKGWWRHRYRYPSQSQVSPTVLNGDLIKGKPILTANRLYLDSLWNINVKILSDAKFTKCFMTKFLKDLMINGGLRLSFSTVLLYPNLRQPFSHLIPSDGKGLGSRNVRGRRTPSFTMRRKISSAQSTKDSVSLEETSGVTKSSPKREATRSSF